MWWVQWVRYNRPSVIHIDTSFSGQEIQQVSFSVCCQLIHTVKFFAYCLFSAIIIIQFLLYWGVTIKNISLRQLTSKRQSILASIKPIGANGLWCRKKNLWTQPLQSFIYTASNTHTHTHTPSLPLQHILHCLFSTSYFYTLFCLVYSGSLKSNLT